MLVGLQPPAQRFAIGQAVAERRQPRVIRVDHLQPFGVLQAFDRVEQHQTHPVAVEVLRQARGHRLHGAGGAVLAHERERQLVRAHRQPLVLLRVAEQLVQAPVELAVLVAQDFQLVAR